jgi:transposase
MSLHPQPLPAIPELTAQVARAAFPRGNRYVRLRDELGGLYTDADFAPLFASRGQPAYAPWRLALVSVFQYAEGLSDQEAAEAVRSRIDWKYALSLELTDTGFDASVLSEFRTRLVAGDRVHLLLDRMLAALQQAGLLRPRGRQRTDATHVLAKVRALNRLRVVAQTLRAALDALAVVAPAWLSPHLDPAWAQRYAASWDRCCQPRTASARAATAVQVGTDGLRLLEAVDALTAPPWLRHVPAVATLRQVWVQQFVVIEDTLCWRDAADLPPAARRIASPYDPEARAACKRDTVWTGYKVHLTESCDPARPHLVTAVATTVATTPDGPVLAAIHADLTAKALLPAEHLVDSGYVDGQAVVDSQTAHGVTVVGPVLANTRWQGQQAGAFDVSCFVVDWDAQQVRCPAGQTSRSWTTSQNRHGQPVIAVRFGRAACAGCAQRAACTTATTHGRKLTLRPRAAHEAVQAARAQQTTAAWRTRYAARAGVEGTVSEAVQVCDLRRCRYRGLAKTQLQHVLTAAALNLRRLGAWWEERPHAPTRTARFVRLLTAAA